jgi:hypothetical protein
LMEGRGTDSLLSILSSFLLPCLEKTTLSCGIAIALERKFSWPKYGYLFLDSVVLLIYMPTLMSILCLFQPYSFVKAVSSSL